MNLSLWQERLQKHFSALRAQRVAEPVDHLVFALEHGLTGAEVDLLADEIRTHVRSAVPSEKHWLPWIVYAAELGYLYAGDQYWQTFEEQTPGWGTYGSRLWIRECFKDFHKYYGGAEPIGPWAQHFSIICWPITHAILPLDLQRQLAKVLYELRPLITSDVLASPKRLGDLIASRSFGASSRFRQLAQEPLLVGQVATALLTQGEPGTSPPILESTLTRIGQDLGRERRTQVWMQGAQDRARAQLHLGRSTIPGGLQPSSQGGAKDPPLGLQKLGVEPRLFLRPSTNDSDTWDAIVELPDFTPLLSRFPELRAVMQNSRCRISGSSGRPRPGEFLLHGPQRVPLKNWPRGDKALLAFEPSSPELNHVLDTELLLRPASLWLFKIAADGMAYEIRSANVRAGSKYILIKKSPFGANPHSAIQPACVNCDGVHAVIIDLPKAVTPELNKFVTALGLQYAGAIRIWPVGITPANWDGEGGVEWLSREIPLLGICADHHVQAFIVEYAGRKFEFTPSVMGSPVFVELPHLLVGRHELKVAARGASGGSVGEPVTLNIGIREPRTWNPGSSGHGGLWVVADPYVPTLEQFWNAEASIEIHGPRGRQIDCTLCLSESPQSSPKLKKSFRMQVPVSTKEWQERIEGLKQDDAVSNAYDVATTGEVRIAAGELGAFTLEMEREFTPLRWAVHKTRAGYSLRLIDDTGNETTAKVCFFPFGTPDLEQPLDAEMFTKGKYILVEPGGMYVASANGYERGIVIPAEVRSLQDLDVNSLLRSHKQQVDDLIELAHLADLWAGSRLTGGVLSESMRSQALGSIMRCIFSLICGKYWAKLESTINRNGTDALPEPMRLFSGSSQEAALGTAIARDAADLAASAPAERATKLGSLAIKFLSMSPAGRVRVKSRDFGQRHLATEVLWRAEGADNPRWLAEFALRLASWPAGVCVWAEGNIHAGVTRLLKVPELARASRYMVWDLNRQSVTTVGGAALPESISWRWS